MGVKRGRDDDDDVTKSNKITEDEAALYDRQIRLWGMECQRRLHEATILVVGLNGVGAEVVKNLTLSGMKSITIMDDTLVSESDTSAQFFVSSHDHGKKRSEESLAAIQELNPNVKISILSGDVLSKPVKFFAEFDAVFVTGCDLDAMIKIDKYCRDTKKVQFYCADTWGSFGYCFLDLPNHTCKSFVKITEVGTLSEPSKPELIRNVVDEKVQYYPLGRCLLAKVGEGLKKRVHRVFVLLHIVNHFRELMQRYPVPRAFEHDYDQLRKIRNAVCSNLGVDVSKVYDEMLKCVFGELSPVCAVIGGILANEIIKGITKKGLPIQNFFLFDGTEFEGVNQLVETSLDDDDDDDGKDAM